LNSDPIKLKAHGASIWSLVVVSCLVASITTTAHSEPACATPEEEYFLRQGFILFPPKVICIYEEEPPKAERPTEPEQPQKETRSGFDQRLQDDSVATESDLSPDKRADPAPSSEQRALRGEEPPASDAAPSDAVTSDPPKDSIPETVMENQQRTDSTNSNTPPPSSPSEPKLLQAKGLGLVYESPRGSWERFVTGLSVYSPGTTDEQLQWMLGWGRFINRYQAFGLSGLFRRNFQDISINYWVSDQTGQWETLTTLNHMSGKVGVDFFSGRASASVAQTSGLVELRYRPSWLTTGAFRFTGWATESHTTSQLASQVVSQQVGGVTTKYLDARTLARGSSQGLSMDVFDLQFGEGLKVRYSTGLEHLAYKHADGYRESTIKPYNRLGVDYEVGADTASVSAQTGAAGSTTRVGYQSGNWNFNVTNSKTTGQAGSTNTYGLSYNLNVGEPASKNSVGSRGSAAADRGFSAPSKVLEAVSSKPAALASNFLVKVDRAAVTRITSLPTASAGPDQTVASAAVVTLDGSGSVDPDGDPLVYAWTQTSGTAVTLSNAAVAQPTFTAPTLNIGDPSQQLVFSLTVSDGATTSAADTVTVNVSAPANGTPTASAGADQVVASAAFVTLDASGSVEPDGQALTYSWSQSAGTSVTLSDAAASQPTFTAPTLNIGDPDAVLTFSVTVSDGFASPQVDTVTITVSAPPNTNPVSNAGPDQVVANAAVVTLDGSSSSDGDGHALTYAWVQTSGLAVTLSDGTAVQPTFTAPTLVAGDPDAVLVFSLAVNDSFNTSLADTVSVTVTAPNATPVANAGLDQSVASAVAVTLDATSSSDINGDSLTYHWAQTGGAAVTLSSNSVSQPTFTAPTLNIGDPDSTLVFALVVNDGSLSSPIDTVTITVVAPVNVAPVANAGSDQSVASNTLVTLSGLGSSDANGHALTYAWTQTAGTAVALSNTASSQPSFTSPALSIGDPDQVLTFSLVVNDGTVNSPADTVTITVVAPVNVAPVANAGPDQVVGSGAAVTLDATASSDANGDGLTYFWSQVSGTPVTLSSYSAPQPTFNAPFANPGDPPLVFSLIVNDGTLSSAMDNVSITVLP
jgi:hypothetical protein